MLTSKQSKALEIYANLMAEAKHRIAAIDTEARRSNTPVLFVREFCFLQLRMLCELIALGCLTAHGDVGSAQTRKLRKEWQAGKIISALVKLHPYFYPQAIKEEQSENGKRGLRATKVGLTKNELLTLYAECGTNLHRGTVETIVSGKPLTQTGIADIIGWTQKIEDLLAMHMLALLGSTKGIVCILRNEDDNNRVQVFTVDATFGS